VGSCDTPHASRGVAKSGDYAYMADRSSGVQVIYVRDPCNPVLVGSYDTPGMARNIAISGDHAFVADRKGGLHVLDISDPPNPVLVGTYDSPGNAYGVAVAGDYVCLADYSSGLHMVRVYQREFDSSRNRAQSLDLGPGYLVDSVRVTTVQSDSILWEISADSGSHWQQVLPKSTWITLDYPGEGLLWRATHFCTRPGINPACTRIGIEYNEDRSGADGGPGRHAFSLSKGRPNPFSESISLGFSTPEPGIVRLDVYDANGRLVAEIACGYYAAGEHDARWDGRDRKGRCLGPGVYFAELKAGSHRATRRIIRIR
jgi:hypothetical protein